MGLLYLEKLRKDVNTLYGYVKCLMAKEDQTSPLVATAWSPNHTIALGNPYKVGNYVYWEGHVYACKADNEGVPPTNTTYWTDLGEGHLLQEEPSTGDQNETDPVFLAWLTSNPLSPYFLTPTGLTSQYVRGDGSLATFPTIPIGIPAGGTTGQILSKTNVTDYNVNWSSAVDGNVLTTQHKRNTHDGWILANPILAVGEVGYETDTGLSKTGNGTTAWNTLSWDSIAHSKQYVKTSQSINKGQAVYVSGSDGTNMIVSKASNATEATSSKTFGLMNGTTASGAYNTVVTEGILGGLDTSTATAGDPVWLGTSGNLIYGLVNKPYAPAHLVFIGIVEEAHATNGKIYVKIQNGFELKEIHDIDLITTSPSNNEVLTYDTATSLWKNKSIGTILGYTPYRYLDATQVTYLGSVIGLTETIVSQTTILANTFNVNDLMKIFYKLSKLVGVSTVTMRIRINTTNTLVGATQISILGLLSNNTYGLENRNINLSGGLAFSYNVASSIAADIINTNTTGTPFVLNTTADLYVFFTIQFGNVADSATFQLANISN